MNEQNFAKALIKCAALWALSLLDYFVSVYIFVNGYGYEANPVLEFLLTGDQYATVILLSKLAALLFLSLTISMAYRHGQLIKVNKALTYLLVAQGLIVAWGLFVIVRS